MTARTAVDEPLTDDHLVAMLRTIGDVEAAGELDNATIGRSLGWTAAMTATSLEAAKGRLLIWGIRVGGTPGPRFEEIELTVQGRRFLTAADH
jgi:hypothetical protein